MAQGGEIDLWVCLLAQHGDALAVDGLVNSSCDVQDLLRRSARRVGNDRVRAVALGADRIAARLVGPELGAHGHVSTRSKSLPTLNAFGE